MRRPGCLRASSKRPMARSVPAMRNTASAYSMSPAAASSSAAARSFALSTVRSDATRTADPPTKIEREPALPKPVPRSVSPCEIRMLLSGTPNTSTTSCANVVARPCPIACVAEKTSMPPSPSTVTVTVSSKMSTPVHSRKVAMPRPRSRPRAFDSAARASKPAQSASATPPSITFAKAPLS